MGEKVCLHLKSILTRITVNSFGFWTANAFSDRFLRF